MEFLNLAWNEISSAGALAIADSFEATPRKNRFGLDLQHNIVNDIGASALIFSLPDDGFVLLDGNCLSSGVEQTLKLAGFVSLDVPSPQGDASACRLDATERRS